MDNGRPDRRVSRSRRLLQDALVALIVEQGYEAVTVQDVLDRADVGRATFYAHFANLEALLLSVFETMRGSLREAMGGLQPGDISRFGEGVGVLGPLFAHAAQHRRLYRALLNSRSGPMLLRYLRDTIARPMPEHLRVMDLAPGGPAPAGVALVTAAMASAVLGVLVWWLEEDAPYSPAEMERVLERLFTYGIAGALTPAEGVWGRRSPP